MKMRMHFLLAAALLAGCGEKPAPPVPKIEVPKEQPRVEFRVGGPDDSEPPHMPFKITAIYKDRKPSTEAPFHAQGGEWTFFDCETDTDPKAVFMIGVMAKRGDGGALVAWGRAALIVKDQESGARFVEAFGKAFSAKMPTASKKAHVPAPLFINTAILGYNLNREITGGFSGGKGGWTATKWFPEFDHRSGEVFFNFNLAQRRGEFSEKDADYADDLLAVFASALRDGPRPERTPENDPNLTRNGPAIGQPRKLMQRRSAHYSFSPGNRFAVYQDQTAIFALPIEKPDGKPIEIGRFDHSPWEVHVLNDDLNLLVQESVPENPEGGSSSDPVRIWWVDFKSTTKKLLRGPEKDIRLAEIPTSPDGRFVATSQWKENPNRKERTKFLFILDRETGSEKVFELPGRDLSVIGWKTSKAGLRAVALTNRWRLDKNEPSELYWADPITGNLERQTNGDPRSDIDNPISPDGRHRVRVGKEELIVTETETGKQRRFVLHEDDHRFVGEEFIEWVSPRYLKVNRPRLTLIDVTTMKMCFPATAGVKSGSHSYKFSSDFRWMLYAGEGKDGEGLFLAPVEAAKEP